MNVIGINWVVSEWNERGLSALYEGYEADVYPTDQDALAPKELPWFWTVKATSAVSEWPELYDCGDAATQADAQDAAETAMRKAAL